MPGTPRNTCQYAGCTRPCYKMYCPEHGEIVHRATRAAKRNHPQGFTPRPKAKTPGQVKAMDAIERVVREAWAKADKWERAIIEGNNSEIDFGRDAR